ncbi:MAG: J domain-containing protein [Alphaproteobacteria bacterium]
MKRRWKELINQYHPDLAQAKGASAREIEACTLKMAEINNAYEHIIKSRQAG